MTMSPELAKEIAANVAEVKALRALREFTGEGIAMCRQALEKANGDPLLAAGFMQVSGQLVNVRSNREERDLARAQSYADDLEMDEQGSICRRKPGSAPRRPPVIKNPDVCTIETPLNSSPSDNSPRETAIALESADAAVAVTAEKVKILREFTGEGMMDCRNKLGQAKGDLLLAVGLLKVSGQLVNYKGNRAERDMGVAKNYAKDLEIGPDGKIRHKAADPSLRRPSGWSVDPDFCSFEK
jgi:hypothetical protein